MGDSLAQLYSLTFFNVLIPGAASRVNLAVSDRPGSLWIVGRCRLWVIRVVLTVVRPLPVYPNEQTFS
jgi:hypothetical protein